MDRGAFPDACLSYSRKKGRISNTRPRQRPSLVVNKPEVIPTTNSRKTCNRGWPVETHMVYPDGQRMISKCVQPEPLQIILNEAITIMLGLFLLKNSFVDGTEQLRMCNLGFSTACTTLSSQQVLYRADRDNEYRKHLINYIFGRVCHMRSQVKVVAQAVVPSRYELLSISVEERKKLVNDLLDSLVYIFPLSKPTDTLTWRSNEPYRHPAVIDVLQKAFFKGKKAIGRRYDANFGSISSIDTSKEIPKPMLALAGVAIFAALKEWTSGNQEDEDFSAADMQEEYDKHIALIDTQILKPDRSGKEKYHNLMAYLYRQANGRPSASAKPSKLPQIDFDGME
ncbi:hypothetical protein K435DRAFT_878754 [Dendrothele bispora CBS 962.96]|uniref:DUF6532 domain-containing protein n=1 Tax=Dendrothele bispora (strain CBS 962.96) TaxID=1314807 RepID=A0A4S8KMD1_DENBC|nr:hypothetical protein K435DRAFT_878754 [Dendrothele bispora CBS 962.96]